MNKDTHEKKCIVCGKWIYVEYPDEYVYKYGGKKSSARFCCSWSCYRKAQTVCHRGIHTNKGEEIIGLLKQGFSIKEVSEKLNTGCANVKYWQKKMESAS